MFEYCIEEKLKLNTCQQNVMSETREHNLNPNDLTTALLFKIRFHIGSYLMKANVYIIVW